jgi:hypothetical protein
MINTKKKIIIIIKIALKGKKKKNLIPRQHGECHGSWNVVACGLS